VGKVLWNCKSVKGVGSYGGAEFARNGICKERGENLQEKDNARKSPKIRNRVNLQGMEFVGNAYPIAY